MPTLLSWLRSKGAPWLGRRWQKRTPAPQVMQEPRMRSQPKGSGTHMTIMPWLEEAVGENDTRRRAYRKMMLDDAVKSSVVSQVFAVAVLDPSARPDDPDASVDRMAADFIQSAIQEMDGGVRGLAEDVAYPLVVDGYVTNEKIYGEIETGKFKGNWFIRRLKPLYPENYSLQCDEYGTLQKIIGQSHNAGKEWPRELFTYARYLPLYDNPRGTSNLAASYRAYWIKDTAWKLRKEFLNVYARGPYLLGTYASDPQKAQLELALEEAMGAGWASVPEGVKVEVIDLALKGTTDFDSAIEKLDREIVNGISGAILQQMEGQKTGSYNAGAQHSLTADLRVWYLAAVLADVLNSQVIPDLLQLNFVGVTSRIRVSFGGVNDADLKASADLDQVLTGIGLKLSEKDAYQRYNRRPPVDESDVLKAPQPVQPGMPGAPPGMVPFSETFAEWDESEHPRDDDGKFVSGGAISAAKGDSTKADELRAKVTDPKERAKLDKALGGKGDQPAAKEPWEMTRGEYRSVTAQADPGIWHKTLHEKLLTAKGGAEVGKALRASHPTAEGLVAAVRAKYDYYNSPDLKSDKDFNGVRQRLKGFLDAAKDTSSDAWHQKSIEGALRKGHTVPPEVLADYPDLAAKHGLKPDTPSPKAPAKAAGKKPEGGDPKAKAGGKPADNANFAERTIALRGKSASPAESLLSQAQKHGTETLADICRSAFTRYVANKGRRKRLFDDEERAKLTEALANVRAVGRLMGRVGMRAVVEKRIGAETFAEGGLPQRVPGILFGKDASPEKALDYFRGLQPKIGELPERFGPLMKREAFTMAVATEEELLKRVQNAIATAMEGIEAGAAFPEPTETIIDQLLADAGVSPRNSAYSDMVARTNAHDAYMQGSEAERLDVYRDDPEAFPVWRWDAVGDERTRASHLARHGKYYPGGVSFQEVRGDEVGEIVNCRCVPIAIFESEWASLQAEGAEVESPPW